MSEAGDGARAVIWRQAFSVGVASGSYAVSFGALSVAGGLSVLQTVALSVLMFTGGSQFAFVGVLAAGGSGGAAVATAGFLGVRNGFYGLTMAPILGSGGRGPRRFLAAHLTIDESTAVGTAQLTVHPGRRDLASLAFWLTGGVLFAFWNTMTLVGALLGDALGDPRRYGLDAAAAGAFAALLWPRLTAGLPRGVAAAAVTVALALVPVTPAGVPVLVAALTGVVAGLLPARSQPVPALDEALDDARPDDARPDDARPDDAFPGAAIRSAAIRSAAIRDAAAADGPPTDATGAADTSGPTEADR